jgi:hypothetical protein
MAFEVVSREEELASVHAFISAAGAGSAALVIEGDAGIGKSTLWLAGIQHARGRGLRVLSSRPAEAECGLAHVGLGDLFEDVFDDVLPALSAPRRRALELALLLEEAPSDPVDHRALVVAVREVLQLLSQREPEIAPSNRPQGGSFGGDRRADRSSLDVACQVRLDGLGRRATRRWIGHNR